MFDNGAEVQVITSDEKISEFWKENTREEKFSIPMVLSYFIKRKNKVYIVLFLGKMKLCPKEKMKG